MFAPSTRLGLPARLTIQARGRPFTHPTNGPNIRTQTNLSSFALTSLQNGMGPYTESMSSNYADLVCLSLCGRVRREMAEKEANKRL